MSSASVMLLSWDSSVPTGKKKKYKLVKHYWAASLQPHPPNQLQRVESTVVMGRRFLSECFKAIWLFPLFLMADPCQLNGV